MKTVRSAVSCVPTQKSDYIVVWLCSQLTHRLIQHNFIFFIFLFFPEFPVPPFVLVKLETLINEIACVCVFIFVHVGVLENVFSHVLFAAL